MKVNYKLVKNTDVLSKDGDTPTVLSIYGLNHGDTDDHGKELMDTEDYSSMGWLVSDGTSTITDNIINGLYTVTPSEHCVWPIWKIFIDNSNGYLTNELLSD